MTASIPAATVGNLRDLGGTPVAGGRVRSGELLRSARLDRLDTTADPAVAALGIRTVVDLRTGSERAAVPDRLPPGARLVTADVLGDGTPVAPARLEKLLSDPRLAEEALGDGRAEEAFAAAYREMVLAPQAAAAYGSLVAAAADPGKRPLLFHCTAGKDRTGWAATVLLLLLGADVETARAAFLAVNPAVRAAFAAYAEEFRASGGDPEVAAALIEVRPGYLDAALRALAERWSSVEEYARQGLGLSGATLERLRGTLVER